MDSRWTHGVFGVAEPLPKVSWSVHRPCRRLRTVAASGRLAAWYSVQSSIRSCTAWEASDGTLHRQACAQKDHMKAADSCLSVMLYCCTALLEE